MSQMTPSQGPAGTGSADAGRAVDAGQGWVWITGGFELFKKQPGIWIAIMLVLVVILIALALLSLLGVIATFVRIVATLLLLTVFTGGLMMGCQALARGGALEIGHLFAGFKNRTADLLVLGALAIVGVAIVMVPVIAIVGTGVIFGALSGDLAGAMLVGGSLLLAWLVAMALIVPVSMAFWFAPALVALRGVAPVAAIRRSFSGCLRNIVPFLIYGIVMLVLSIFATIPLLLGWLVLGPVAVASVYVAYRDIYGDS